MKQNINEVSIAQLKVYFNQCMRVKNLRTGRKVKMSTYCWDKGEYISALEKQNKVQDCLQFVNNLETAKQN